ncbi:MAG: hypothetical protein AB1798_07980 [Spirochaetota bacterium]
MSIREVFHKIALIFPGKKDNLREEITLKTSLFRIFSRALSGTYSLSGKSIPETAETIDVQSLALEDFQGEVDGVENGFIEYIFFETDEFPLIFFFPENYFSEINGDQDPFVGQVKLIRSVSNSILKYADSTFPGRFIKQYDFLYKNELFWHISDHSIFKVTAGFSCFYCLINEKKLSFLNNLPQDKTPGRDSALTGSEGEGTGISLITINKPLDLIITEYILPPVVSCGNYLLKSNIDTLVSGIFNADEFDRLRKTPGIWISTFLESVPGRFELFFFIPADPKQMTSQFVKTIQQIATCFFRSVLEAHKSELGLQVHKAQIQTGKKLIFQKSSPLLQLKSKIFINQRFIPCDLFLTQESVQFLLRSHGEAWDGQYLPKYSHKPIEILLSLNQNILRKKLTTFYLRHVNHQSDLFALKKKGKPFIPFPLFCRLLEEKDLYLIFQYITVHVETVKSLRSLFYYTRIETIPGGKSHTCEIAPVFFDDQRIKAVLPRLQAELWDRDRRNIFFTPEEYKNGNISVMKSLYFAALKKDLLLSGKALFILENIFYKIIQGDIIEKLTELTQKNIPFESLQKLQRKSLQQYLAGKNNKFLSLMLIGSEKGLDIIKPNISRRRRVNLVEDYNYYLKQFKMQQVKAEEVCMVKETSEAEITSLLENKEKMQVRPGGRDRRNATERINN